eukprot:7435933-Pyramimonas_sp.AAC.1
MAWCSILVQMSALYHQFYSIRSLPDISPRSTQRWITRELLSEFPLPRAALIIYPRICKWAIGIPVHSIELSVKRLSRINKYLPTFIVTAILKTIFNGWNTSRRYRCGALVCKMGCYATGCDDVLHYASCPIAVGVLKRALRFFPEEYGSDPLASFLHHLFPNDLDSMLSCAIALDALHSSYQSLRASARPSSPSFT